MSSPVESLIGELRQLEGSIKYQTDKIENLTKQMGEAIEKRTKLIQEKEEYEKAIKHLQTVGFKEITQ